MSSTCNRELTALACTGRCVLRPRGGIDDKVEDKNLEAMKLNRGQLLLIINLDSTKSEC